MTLAGVPRTIGFHGKLPSLGDFVGRGLPASFLEPWTRWVNQAIPAARDLLGADWREAWLVAPVWRFSLPARACGPDSALGVMLPSMDRVGRAYPLVIAELFPDRAAPTDTASSAAFLDAAEDAARHALAEDPTPEELLARIIASPAAPRTESGGSGHARWWTEGGPLVAATSVVLDGLPPMPDHAAMLAGAGVPRSCQAGARP